MAHILNESYVESTKGIHYMGVEPKIGVPGYPQNWMVKIINGKTPMKQMGWNLGGKVFPYFWGWKHPYIYYSMGECTNYGYIYLSSRSDFMIHGLFGIYLWVVVLFSAGFPNLERFPHGENLPFLLLPSNWWKPMGFLLGNVCILGRVFQQKM